MQSSEKEHDEDLDWYRPWIVSDFCISMSTIQEVRSVQFLEPLCAPFWRWNERRFRRNVEDPETELGKRFDKKYFTRAEVRDTL